MCLKQWDLGYQDLLDLSQFPTLKNRRLYLKLCTLHKIMHGYFYFHHNVFLLQVNRHSYSLPLVHIPHARTNAFKSSSVSIWNNLPHEALIAPTIYFIYIIYCTFVFVLIIITIGTCITLLSDKVWSLTALLFLYEIIIIYRYTLY